MNLVAETGVPWVRARTGAMGGAGGPGPLTALGVLAGMRTVARRIFDAPSLAGRRVLVLGAGAVGGPLIELLLAENAEVLVSDVDPEALRRLPRTGGVTFVPDDEVWDTPCDVLAPCALGGVLGARTISRLRCRAVVGAANRPLATPGDAVRLHAREILYAPDFVVNAGGAVGITGMESFGWSREEAEERVLGIGDTLARVLDLAEAEGWSPDEAARELARRRLDAVTPPRA